MQTETQTDATKCFTPTTVVGVIKILHTFISFYRPTAMHKKNILSLAATVSLGLYR